MHWESVKHLLFLHLLQQTHLQDFKRRNVLDLQHNKKEAQNCLFVSAMSILFLKNIKRFQLPCVFLQHRWCLRIKVNQVSLVTDLKVGFAWEEKPCGDQSLQSYNHQTKNSFSFSSQKNIKREELKHQNWFFFY